MQRVRGEVTQPVRNRDEDAEPTNLLADGRIELTIAGEEAVMIDDAAGHDPDKQLDDDDERASGL